MLASAPALNRPLPAIALRLTSAGLFAVMAALLKLADDAGVPLLHMMFWRFAFGLIPLLLYVRLRSSFGALRTARPRAHLVRGAIGLASMWTSFEAVRRLPLAEATTISFAAPLLAIALSTVFLGEKVGWRRWSAVALGMVGVAVVMQPGGTKLDELGLLFSACGAVGVAAITLAIRRLGATEPPETTVWWFTIGSAAVLAPTLLTVPAPYGSTAWGLLLAIGLTGGTAQIAMTSSLRLAPVPVVAPFDYSQIVWAVALGWLLYDRLPAPATWAGAALIVAAGLYSLFRERQLAKAGRLSGR